MIKGGLSRAAGKVFAGSDFYCCRYGNVPGKYGIYFMVFFVSAFKFLAGIIDSFRHFPYLGGEYPLVDRSDRCSSRPCRYCFPGGELYGAFQQSRPFGCDYRIIMVSFHWLRDNYPRFFGDMCSKRDSFVIM